MIKNPRIIRQDKKNFLNLSSEINNDILLPNDIPIKAQAQANKDK